MDCCEPRRKRPLLIVALAPRCARRRSYRRISVDDDRERSTICW